jgi:hypothetical protein
VPDRVVFGHAVLSYRVFYYFIFFVSCHIVSKNDRMRHGTDKACRVWRVVPIKFWIGSTSIPAFTIKFRIWHAYFVWKNAPSIMDLRVFVKSLIVALQLLALSKLIEKFLSRYWYSSMILNTNLKIISASCEYFSSRKESNLLFENYVPKLISSVIQWTVIVQYDLSCLPADQISEVNDTLYFAILNSSYKFSRSVPCLVPVSFRAVSNALTMLCRVVPNFLKAGHDTVKTRTRNSTVPVPVPCLNPFCFQPCSYRSIPFPATAYLNLEHHLEPATSLYSW